MSDGSFWQDQADVIVTLAGLPGGSERWRRALINVPAKAKRGEIIEIKTLVAHPMETGYRRGPSGEAIAPRHHPPLRLHL